MPRPRKVLGPGELPDRRHWPKLPISVQQDLFLFLTAWQMAANAAVERAKQTCALYPEETGFQNQVTYWQNVVSAIAWLLSRVDKRQEYLAVIQRQEEERLLQAATAADTSSAADSSEKPSDSGATTEQPPTRGRRSARSSKSATRKPRRTVSTR